tara:strand:- start:36 stop:350 length:315 start_codon:yes stop_codon:yes gene_type:complete
MGLNFVAISQPHRLGMYYVDDDGDQSAYLYIGLWNDGMNTQLKNWSIDVSLPQKEIIVEVAMMLQDDYPHIIDGMKLESIISEFIYQQGWSRIVVRVYFLTEMK